MTRMDPILVVNAGSSSVKFQLFADRGTDDLTLQIKGQVDGIGTRAATCVRAPRGVVAIDRRFDREQISDVPAALQESAPGCANATRSTNRGRPSRRARRSEI